MENLTRHYLVLKKNKDGSFGRFRINAPIESFKKYGKSLFGYFFLLKYLSIIFVILTLFSFCLIYLNFSSKNDKDDIFNKFNDSFLQKSTIANKKMFRVRNNLDLIKFKYPI